MQYYMALGKHSRKIKLESAQGKGLTIRLQRKWVTCSGQSLSEIFGT